MPSSLLPWIKRALTVAIGGIFLFLLFKFRNDFHLIRNVTPGIFAALSLLVCVSILLNGLKLNRVLRSFGIHLTGKEWVGLAFISATLNGVVFKSGALVTSSYLKRKHELPYASFVGAMGADHLMMIFINALAGSAISIYLVLSGKPLVPVAAGFLLLTLGLILVMRRRFILNRQSNPFFDAVARAVRALDGILQNQPLFHSLLLQNLVLVAVMGLRFYVACQALALDIPLAHCYLFTTVMSFVRLVPMIQSDIGSRELAVGFLSEAVGSGFKQGMLATVVDRIIELFWAVLIAACFKNLLFPSPKEQEA